MSVCVIFLSVYKYKSFHVKNKTRENASQKYPKPKSSRRIHFLLHVCPAREAPGRDPRPSPSPGRSLQPPSLIAFSSLSNGAAAPYNPVLHPRELHRTSSSPAAEEGADRNLRQRLLGCRRRRGLDLSGSRSFLEFTGYEFNFWLVWWRGIFLWMMGKNLFF